jgi:NAD(P)-dependent dehydrogenase (short-subunit alcohol dehydrogenase family)
MEKLMGKLAGKIALVSGASSGIGLATAKEFVKEGAYVFITGRRDSELAAAAREIGRNVTGVRGDVSNLRDLDRLFAQIKQEKGNRAFIRADMDNGLEGSPNSRKRGEPGFHRHARTGRTAGFLGNGPATLEDAVH